MNRTLVATTLALIVLGTSGYLIHRGVKAKRILIENEEEGVI